MVVVVVVVIKINEAVQTVTVISCNNGSGMLITRYC